VINTVAGPRLVQKDEAIASLSERVRVLEQARVKTSAELTAALEDLAQKDKEWAAKLKDAKEQTTQDIVAQEAASKDRLVKMHERYMRKTARSASEALDNSERRRRVLTSRISQATALLRMNSAEAFQGAYELLDTALHKETASDDTLVFGTDPESRTRQLITLSHTEVDCGKWTALLRTELAARAVPESRAVEGFLLLNDTRTQNNIGCRATTGRLMSVLASHGLPISHSITLAELVELRGPGWFPDAAFLVDPAPTGDFRPDHQIALGSDSILDARIQEPYVILTGSSALYGRDRAATDMRDSLNALCTRLRDHGLNPVLWEADKPDRLLLRTTALELNLPYMSASVPLRAAREVVSGATCMFSGRWHASILAARWGCTPILGDANFFKTQALQDAESSDLHA
jgi:hypothetical protein